MAPFLAAEEVDGEDTDAPDVCWCASPSLWVDYLPDELLVSLVSHSISCGKTHGACQPLVPQYPVMLLSPTMQVWPKSVMATRWLAEGVVAQRMFSSFRSR